MDFGDRSELTSFRSDFRRWLEDNVLVPDEGEHHARFLQRWHQSLYRGGWVGLSWPRAFGGRDLTASHEAIINEELGRIGAPDAPRIGYLGRAILAYGTEGQKDRYLPTLLNGTDYWCQGFSEPGAGSDLASLSTRAESKDDCYLLNGQKVWISYGEYADLCLLLARTGSKEDRHRGISAFVLPMDLIGVEARPLRAITGESEFCEIFLTDVHLPKGQLLGQEGDGWAIAMMTVAYERGAADVGYLSRLRASLADLEDWCWKEGAPSPETLHDLGRLKVVYSILNNHVRRRLRERELQPGLPGPEMSVDKILMTDVEQRLYETALKLKGEQALIDDPSACLEEYLYSRAASIYGGSQQIQLNIIAQRILGLPR